MLLSARMLLPSILVLVQEKHGIVTHIHGSEGLSALGTWVVELDFRIDSQVELWTR